MSSNSYGSVSTKGASLAHNEEAGLLSNNSDDIVNESSFQSSRKTKLAIVLSLAGLVATALVAISSNKGSMNFYSYKQQNLLSYSEDELQTMFEDFKSTYGKSYPNPDNEAERYEIFKSNTVYIEQMNRASSYPYATFGINQFADMTADEFQSTVLMNRDDLTYPTSLPGETAYDGECTACHRYSNLTAYLPEAGGTIPQSFDWRDWGAVTDVKNQAYCGSCWSFGSVGDIEGAWYLAGNDLTSLSEQQLVSCDSKYDFGCDGGWQEAAFEYIREKGGIVSYDTLPYKGVDEDNVEKSPSCPSSVSKKNYVATISHWSHMSQSPDDELSMMLKLIKVGPMTLSMNAKPMTYYKSGIADPSDCDPIALDHAVLLVGYGVEDGVKYWIIKNSWASYWGESGYFRIIRGTNSCGVANDVVHSFIN